MTDVSLIITTYNRPDALDLVLQSALRQSVLPAEIIVADDGSGEETRKLIARFAALSPVPVKHTWQPDDGFRAAESRNRALAAADSSYIIFIDGDMVLHTEFVRDHLSVAEPGILVQGSRVLLTEPATRNLLGAPLPPDYRPPFYCSGIEKKLAAVRCRCLKNLVAAKTHRKLKNIKSCNMGLYRRDALAVNGFNNAFVGWGREDSEFAARLYHNGIRRKNLKFGGLAYHLWHREAGRAALPHNDALLRQTLEQKSRRCADGVNRFLSDCKSGTDA
ncbi:glycosyltransferase family 2 protein [Neisseria leonii]|uniref:glycosyltransferase family 2 protein n=1 Tax=Neisseria leonii TaxID=2995413 RepID=UPI00237BE1A8|nr:glycosyltransferase family 2 protein [Neisseria sp. 3986]MDD9325930.1 glycosyltransferase family 2 protein [Neisseria sp. 3986]